MCGIYGIASVTGVLRDPDAPLRTMRDALRHRGPDGEGLCRSPRAAIGVTRLRVIDLNPRADQPFSDSRGVILASNGEIYNAADLSRRYPAYPYRSHSDAERLVPLYLDGGAAGLADAVGMFAVAIWDEPQGRLILARDRAGEKPLFWAEHQGAIWFASEIGALLQAGVPARPLDRTALGEYLRRGYVREPRTLHERIHKVPAGGIMTFDASGVALHRYWNPADAALPPMPPSSLSHLLERAVTQQLTADVPVGVFTSGGLDSSLLAALSTRALGPSSVHTFAVGFPDQAYDERPWAARLARHLKTAHLDIEVQDDQVPEALDALVRTGEPLGDPAAIPTLLLSRAARRHVTVVLSGEGADELFGGYPTYLGHRWAKYAFPRQAGAVLSAITRVLPSSRSPVPLTVLAERFFDAASLPWAQRHEAWFGTGLAGLGAVSHDAGATPASPLRGNTTDEIHEAMVLDYTASLRERLLVKVDRATMLASLEARAPFLDPDVTRAALGAPGGAHVGMFQTKRLLREVARTTVPPFILRRRKRGLSAPVGRWLLGPAAGLLAACQDLPRLTGGLVRAEALAGLLRSPRAVLRHGRALWPLVALRAWIKAWNLEEEWE